MLLHWQTAAVISFLGAYVGWYEQSTDGEGPEEGLEMTEGEDNVSVELGDSLGFYYAMTGNLDAAPLLGGQEMHLSRYCGPQAASSGRLKAGPSTNAILPGDGES